jgi:hypothetical protein
MRHIIYYQLWVIVANIQQIYKIYTNLQNFCRFF